MSIISSSYTASALTTPSERSYTNVDPASYQGSWSGIYAAAKKFKITVSDVRASGRR